MTAPDDDDVLARLSRLPSPDVAPACAERIRRRAQRVLAAERRRAASPWLAGAEQLWSRVLEPLLITSVAATYIIWAVRAVEGLYR